MTKLELSRVKAHFKSAQANNGVGTEDENDIRHTIEANFEDFAKDLVEIRAGVKKDSKGNYIKPIDIPFHKAVQVFFGCDVKGFMKSVGIYSQSDTLFDVAMRLGAPSFNKTTMEEILIKGSSFDASNTTKGIAADFRFLIPELIATAIRIGYEGSAMHLNWIAMTQQMSQQKITMPRIMRGDGMPTRINEGANIPVGSVQFGKKEASVFKVGTGFEITDELINQSSLDMMFIFLENVGVDMSIGADTEAIRVLLNGEQADLSESAPVVGVDNTTNGFTFKDIKRVTTRGRRLKHNYTRLITGEDDGINITGLDRFEGFNGDTRLASINSIIGVPDRLENDVQILPANKIMFLDPRRAMAKLQFNIGMRVERQRNIKSQKEELYVSDWLGFAIIRRDARVVQDKSVTYAATPFPAYMDIDARIAAAFNSY